MNRLILIFFFCVYIPLIGCNDKEPTLDDLSGNWVNNDGARLLLNKDGTFIGESLSYKFFFRIIKDNSVIKFNGNGVWKIKKTRSSWDQLPYEIDLNFIKTSTKESRIGTNMLLSGSNFMENKPPWKTLFIWVEEEGGERYEFKR